MGTVVLEEIGNVVLEIEGEGERSFREGIGNKGMGRRASDHV
jgi:hypothetical protein